MSRWSTRVYKLWLRGGLVRSHINFDVIQFALKRSALTCCLCRVLKSASEINHLVLTNALNVWNFCVYFSPPVRLPLIVFEERKKGRVNGSCHLLSTKMDSARWFWLRFMVKRAPSTRIIKLDLNAASNHYSVWSPGAWSDIEKLFVVWLFVYLKENEVNITFGTQWREQFGYFTIKTQIEQCYRKEILN